MNMNRDTQKHHGFDLLRINLIRKVLLWAGFPYIFQTSHIACFSDIGKHWVGFVSSQWCR